VWTPPSTDRKVDAISVRLTNPGEWHEADMLRGLRDFRRGHETAHADAFGVFLCRVGHCVLGIESMIEDYLDAMAEANKGAQ
jgi:hypothetical protein